MMQYYFLTGDIGGTNSRMAFYDAQCNQCTPILEKHYRNAEHILPENYNDPKIFINQIIIPFLKYCFDQMKNTSEAASQNNYSESNIQIIATFAVAGMVLNNQVNLTNLGNMLIDGNAIANNNENLYLRKIIICRIINDFVAVTYIHHIYIVLFIDSFCSCCCYSANISFNVQLQLHRPSS